MLDQLEDRAAQLEAANSLLGRRVAELENETHDLAVDLQAARAKNRELMREPSRSAVHSAQVLSSQCVDYVRHTGHRV